MLRLESVSSHYGQIEALNNVSLEIKQGELVTLIGANGAGKTTLLMTICGEPRASAGHIYLHDEEITRLPSHETMRRGLAVVPEGRRVFAGMTVLENLSMGGFFIGNAQFRRNLQEVYDLFPRLQERQSQRAGTLSGGEQQMLAIGRALMSDPELLLLDEPSLGLAPIIIQQIFEIIAGLREKGVTIFLVEQNAHQALQIADRGYVLENGRIILHDSGAKLLTNDQVKQAYLGG